MEQTLTSAARSLKNADAILIGASNGLSISEGYNIFADNEMFRRQFSDFRQKYGLRNVLDGLLTQEMNPEDHQKFLNRLTELWTGQYEATKAMKDLKEIVGDKPYFILTTNGDEHLEAAGFSPEKIWEIEGTFRLARDGQAPVNRQKELNRFLQEYGGKRLVIFELGIGSRNRIIKLPLMQLAFHEPEATYITLNLPDEIYIPGEIASKSIALAGDITATLDSLIKQMKSL
ncbi:MAG: hypothetical protein K2M11_09385 [Paramuribaculum sp.]|nr:hypothetical protein [Paramuribaculum sp.]